jgi:hypothetical protein
MRLRYVPTTLLIALVASACEPRVATRGAGDRAPGWCPDGSKPMFDVPADLPPAGYDTEIHLRASLGCNAARGGRFEWRVAEGGLRVFRVDEDHLGVVARTEPLAIAAPPWGIVPRSPRTRGAATIEVTWTGRDGTTLRRSVRVSAIARATGIPSIARGQEVLLGGRGWTLLLASPKEATAVLAPAGPDLFRFRSDGIGEFVLRDGAGRVLSIRSGTHERVPLDCGRSECHSRAAEDVQTSPMTHVLHNGLEGEYGADYSPSCALSCHAVGEPGLPDDGFAAVQSALGFAFPTPHAGAWAELPRALRRLGGVGCTSCHGPAAIPEPTARFAVLRADVCATCHDAPPRYAHVANWRESLMARADADPEAARTPACQRCHTTAGFLRTLSSAQREDAPANVGPVGIACAACHAPHAAAHTGSLLREVSVPAEFGALEARSRICVPCHLGGAATVWAGTAEAPSPHASLGCVACHMPEHKEDALGTSHRFRVDPAVCRTCHAAGDPKFAPRTEPRPEGRPPHASPTARATVEDRAAFVHNANFARRFRCSGWQCILRP